MLKLIRKIVLLGVTILLPLMLYNYFTDFYGVFSQNISKSKHEPNFRLIKTRYLINNPNKYNKLIFGSSRVGKILAYRRDQEAYNMYYSEGVPAEFLEDISTLIEGNCIPSEIYVGLDIFSFRILPEKHKTQLLRLPFQNDPMENLATYLQMLVDPPKIGFPEYEIATNFDYENSGSPLHFMVDTLIEANIEKHMKDKKFDNIQIYRGKRIQKTLLELEEIKALCIKYDIKLKVFMNPIYAGTYSQYPIEEVKFIKKVLADVIPFVDYSGFNKVTVNRKNYYESSHYRYFIGDSIWNDLTGKEQFSIAKQVSPASIDTLFTMELNDRRVYKALAIEN
jgi:hypothetical protein